MENQKPPETKGSPQPRKESLISNDAVAIGIIVLLVMGLIWGMFYLFNRYIGPYLKSDTPPEMAQAPTPAEVSGGKMPTPPAPNVRPADKVKPPPLPPVPVIDISKDPAQARETAALAFLGFDIKRLQLNVSDVKKEAKLRIPAGMLAMPRGPSNVCSFVVHETMTLDLKPGASTNGVLLKVAGLDYRGFNVPVDAVPFDLNPPPEDDPVARFAAVASTRGSSWHVVQTAVWALRNDISRKDLAVFNINDPDPATPDVPRERPVASYQEIKQAEAILSGLGLNPDKFRLFAEEREERAKLFAQIDFQKPAPNYRDVLRGKSLARYKGDADLERVLLQYVSHHKNPGVRRAALENLAAMGISDTPDNLARRATYGDFHSRFLAALTLFNLGDERAWPLLALHAEDPLFGNFCSKALEAAISKKSGERKTGKETMLAYWTRAIGWTRVPGNSDSVASLKSSVDSLLSRTAQEITKALEDIVSPDENLVSGACYTLQRYPRDRMAFDALCRTALNHQSANIRHHALSSLAQFCDFNPNPVCETIIKRDDERLVNQALQVACQVQFDGVDKILGDASQHTSRSIRQHVANLIGANKLQEGEPVLVRMAKNDTDTYVRESAMRALVELRSPNALKMLRNTLSTGNRNEKFSAMRSLMLWKDDTQAVDVLERYRNDPDVGQEVSAYLRNRGQ